MERMEKQTAVDWMAYQLNLEPDGWMKDLIEQAKEMEKEQMIDFADDYEWKCTTLYTGRTMSPEQYYNKTFKSE